MTRQIGNHRASIAYNGEIYNMPALRQELIREDTSRQELKIVTAVKEILTGKEEKKDGKK